MKRLLGYLACLSIKFLLNGCSDSVDGSSIDSGVPTSAPDPIPQQDTYVPPEPSRHVDSNGNDCAGYC